MHAQAEAADAEGSDGDGLVEQRPARARAAASAAAARAGRVGAARATSEPAAAGVAGVVGAESVYHVQVNRMLQENVLIINKMRENLLSIRLLDNIPLMHKFNQNVNTMFALLPSKMPPFPVQVNDCFLTGPMPVPAGAGQLPAGVVRIATGPPGGPRRGSRPTRERRRDRRRGLLRAGAPFASQAAPVLPTGGPIAARARCLHRRRSFRRPRRAAHAPAAGLVVGVLAGAVAPSQPVPAHGGRPSDGARSDAAFFARGARAGGARTRSSATRRIVRQTGGAGAPPARGRRRGVRVAEIARPGRPRAGRRRARASVRHGVVVATAAASSAPAAVAPGRERAAAASAAAASATAARRTATRSRCPAKSAAARAPRGGVIVGLAQRVVAAARRFARARLALGHRGRRRATAARAVPPRARHAAEDEYGAHHGRLGPEPSSALRSAACPERGTKAGASSLLEQHAMMEAVEADQNLHTHSRELCDRCRDAAIAGCAAGCGNPAARRAARNPRPARAGGGLIKIAPEHLQGAGAGFGQSSPIGQHHRAARARRR